MKLILITNNYPFSYGEAFLENERSYMPNFEDVIILPCKEKEFVNNREEGNNVRIYKSKDNIPNIIQKLQGCSRALFTLDVLKEIYSLLKKKSISISKIIDLIFFKYDKTYKVKNFKKYLDQVGVNKKDKVIFYSYWLDNTAFIGVKLSRYYPFSTVISRAHRCDLYEEESESGYIPFQKKNIEELDEIYCISQDGRDYLKQKYPQNANKIMCSKLGTCDWGSEKYTGKTVLNIISCSYVVPVKRIHLIIEILKGIQDIPIFWTHIGDGKELGKIKRLSEGLPANISVSFMGQMGNREVIENYKENEYHLFINVSESEGIPVSIMEATSFGIPVMATDVGGTRELVNEKTGILLKKDFDILSAVNAVREIYSKSDREYIELRNSTRRFWVENFYAQSNYFDFYKMVMRQKDKDL